MDNLVEDFSQLELDFIGLRHNLLRFCRPSKSDRTGSILRKSDAKGSDSDEVPKAPKRRVTFNPGPALKRTGSSEFVKTRPRSHTLKKKRPKRPSALTPAGREVAAGLRTQNEVNAISQRDLPRGFLPEALRPKIEPRLPPHRRPGTIIGSKRPLAAVGSSPCGSGGGDMNVTPMKRRATARALMQVSQASSNKRMLSNAADTRPKPAKVAKYPHSNPSPAPSLSPSFSSSSSSARTSQMPNGTPKKAPFTPQHSKFVPQCAAAGNAAHAAQSAGKDSKFTSSGFATKDTKYIPNGFLSPNDKNDFYSNGPPSSSSSSSSSATSNGVSRAPAPLAAAGATSHRRWSKRAASAFARVNSARSSSSMANGPSPKNASFGTPTGAHRRRGRSPSLGKSLSSSSRGSRLHAYGGGNGSASGAKGGTPAAAPAASSMYSPRSSPAAVPRRSAVAAGSMSARLHSGARHRRRSGSSVTPPPISLSLNPVVVSNSIGVPMLAPNSASKSYHVSRIARPASANPTVGGSNALQKTATNNHVYGVGGASGASISVSADEKHPVASLQSPRLVAPGLDVCSVLSVPSLDKSGEKPHADSASSSSHRYDSRSASTSCTKRKLEDLLSDEALNSFDRNIDSSDGKADEEEEKADTSSNSTRERKIDDDRSGGDPAASDMSICRKKLKFDVKENDDPVPQQPPPATAAVAAAAGVLPPHAPPSEVAAAADREPLRPVSPAPAAVAEPTPTARAPQKPLAPANSDATKASSVGGKKVAKEKTAKAKSTKAKSQPKSAKSRKVSSLAGVHKNGATAKKLTQPKIRSFFFEKAPKKDQPSTEAEKKAAPTSKSSKISKTTAKSKTATSETPMKRQKTSAFGASATKTAGTPTPAPVDDGSPPPAPPPPSGSLRRSTRKRSRSRSVRR